MHPLVSSTRGRRAWIVACRQFLLQPRNILKQPAAGQFQKAQAELGVLKIELLEPIVTKRLYLAAFAADERVRAPAVRGQHAEFANHGSRRYLHAGLAQNKASGVDEIHSLRDVAFAEQDLAGLDVATRHKRAQPGHVDLAAAR